MPKISPETLPPEFPLGVPAAQKNHVAAARVSARPERVAQREWLRSSSTPGLSEVIEEFQAFNANCGLVRAGIDAGRFSGGCGLTLIANDGAFLDGSQDVSGPEQAGEICVGFLSCVEQIHLDGAVGALIGTFAAANAVIGDANFAIGASIDGTDRAADHADGIETLTAADRDEVAAFEARSVEVESCASVIVSGDAGLDALLTAGAAVEVDDHQGLSPGQSEGFEFRRLAGNFFSVGSARCLLVMIFASADGFFDVLAKSGRAIHQGSQCSGTDANCFDVLRDQVGLGGGFLPGRGVCEGEAGGGPFFAAEDSDFADQFAATGVGQRAPLLQCIVPAFQAFGA